MGIFDVILGRRKVAGPAPDRLFAMATAYVTLETGLNMKSTGEAGIVFQPLATADFQSIVADMEEVVHGTGSDTGTSVDTKDDSFGYRWMILRDPDFEDLVVGVNAVSTALEGGGYGDRVLAAVFPFETGGPAASGEAAGGPVTTSRGKRSYWIYNYKRGAFYPFVPSGGEQQRDSEAELRLKAQIGADLPVEPELERWFPLWGAPL
jgi:PspA associated protein B